MKIISLYTLFCSSLIIGQDRIQGAYDSLSNFFVQDSVKFWIGEFEGGFAKFSKEGYSGIINKGGKIILPRIYDEVLITDSLFYANSKNSHYVFSQNGDIIDESVYDFIIKKHGVIFLKPLQSYFHPYANISSRIYNYGTDFYDFDGNFLGQSSLYSHLYFSSNVVQNDTIYDQGYRFVKRSSKVVYENKTGEILFDFKYENNIESAKFKEGLVKVSLNGKEGLIDRMGNEIFPPIYDHVDIEKGYVLIHEDSTIWLMSKQHKRLIQITNQPIIFPNPIDNHPIQNYFNAFGLMKVNENNNFGLIDANAELILPKKYTDIKVHEYFIEARNERGLGIYTLKGELVIPHQKSDVVYVVKNGFVLGCVSKTYSEPNSISENLILYDRNFNQMATVDSCEASYFDGPYYGLYPYRNLFTKKCGYLDLANLRNSSAKYIEIDCIQKANAIICTDKKGKTCLIKAYPDVNKQINYEIYEEINSELLIVRKMKFLPRIINKDRFYENPENWQYGLINEIGEVIQPIKYESIKRRRGPEGAVLCAKDGKKYKFFSNDGILIK